MKEMPEKFVVIRRDRENPHDEGTLAYGPELRDRCEHWLEQVNRTTEPRMGPLAYSYSIKPAKIVW